MPPSVSSRRSNTKVVSESGWRPAGPGASTPPPLSRGLPPSIAMAAEPPLPPVPPAPEPPPVPALPSGPPGNVLVQPASKASDARPPNMPGRSMPPPSSSRDQRRKWLGDQKPAVLLFSTGCERSLFSRRLRAELWGNRGVVERASVDPSMVDSLVIQLTAAARSRSRGRCQNEARRWPRPGLQAGTGRRVVQWCLGQSAT